MNTADLVFGVCLLIGGSLLLLTLIFDDLLGEHSFNAGVGGSTLIAVVAGLTGSGVVFVAFKALGQAESTESFSLQDMIGSTGRVSVAIPANRFGTVLISFAGASHNMGATADTEIPAGRVVKVVGVAGN